MPKMKMVHLLLLLVLTGSFLFASGAGESDQALTVKVAYPIAVDAPVSEILNGMAAQFESQNPNVTIETVYAGGYTDTKTMLQTTIDGGGEPPALTVMLATDLFDLANAEYIEPMTDLIDALPNSESYIADFLPAFMENSYYNGDIWSLPFQRSAVVLYYNADLFEAEGVAVPDSLQSLAEAAEALTVRSGSEVTRWGIEWPSGWPYWLFQPLAMGMGKNIIGDDDAEVFFDNPKVIAAIEYYNALSAQYGAMPAGVQASWGTVVPNLVSGNTAMIVHSSGSLSSVLAQADFEVGVMGVPGVVPGTQYSVPGGGNLYITAGLDERTRRVAFDFATFLTRPENTAAFSIQTGYIATRDSAFDEPEMKAFIAEHPQAGETRDILEFAGKELALQNLGEVRSIFHKYLQAAINGEISAAAAMAQAQSEADAALADFR